VPPAVRDTVVDFVRVFSTRTELSARWVLAHLPLAPTQCYRWTDRYGRVNTHNGQVPEGYRRMTFMMLDADVVAVSPTTVYRVLKGAASRRSVARPG
jgi:hypothetical protein